MNPFKMRVGVVGFCGGFFVLGLGVTGLGGAGLSAFAQGNATTAEARANELQSRYMTAVKVELTSKLDAKSAAAEQPVTAKTLAAVTLADGTSIPAGTMMEGRVVAVRAVSSEHAGSMLTVTFDHAEFKDGRSLPVRSLVRGIAATGTAAGQGSSAGIGASGRSSDTGFGGLGEGGLGAGGLGGGGLGGGGLGGGGLGGGVGGPIGAGGGAGGGVNGSGGGLGGGSIDGGVGGGVGGDIGVGGAGGGLGGGVGGAGTGVGGVGGRSTTRGRNSRQVVLPTESAPPPILKTADGGESVNPAPKPTGLPGVMLMTNPASEVSGTLTEFGKNIRLDSGTQITLGVIAR